ADDLKNKRLYLPLHQLPKLGEAQFYFHDIIGYSIKDAIQGGLGEIITIYNLPHQDLIAMNYQEKEVLIPITDDIVKSVDHGQKEVTVLLPEGLPQIYLED